ncbi:hypothetical protein HDV00_003892 [Rhizophlyctis rosea]|nr:hypothetical protein HDV00_003892 [Rhizophlyctis rosea]
MLQRLAPSSGRKLPSCSLQAGLTRRASSGTARPKLQCAVVGAYKTKDGSVKTASNAELPSHASQQLQATNFGGDKKQFRLLYNGEAGSTHLLGVVGMGEQQEDVNKAADATRLAASSAVLALHALDPKSAKAIKFDGLGNPKAAGEGAALATYSFNHYKGPDAQIGQIEPYIEGSGDTTADWEMGVAIAHAQNYARTLAETPANLLTPTIFAKRAEELLNALKNSNVTVKVHDRAWAEEQKMGSFLSVARGSEEPPKFLEIVYRGGKQDETFVGLVGKGVTFDTGGISIKPSADMAMMKGDMGGAAAVLGAVWGIAKLRVPANVVAVIPLTENMPSGRATKPGDVVWARNGMSIEVDNTDAEGRLILADAIHYVSTSYQLSQLVELSTLTGAMDVALGSVFAGVFTTSDLLWKELKAAGEKSGDPFWRMPLDDRYAEQIKSHVADLKNVGGRSAGSCTAAIFLKNFVGDKKDGPNRVPFAHIDIAGVMHNKAPSGYLAKGMTGRPTRSIIEFVRNIPHGRTRDGSTTPGTKPTVVKNQTRSLSISLPSRMPRGARSEPTNALPEKREHDERDTKRKRFEPSDRVDSDRTDKPNYSHLTVRIRRERIHHLSGWEKLDLFKDFVNAGQTEDALYTYELLKNNQILPRLRYLDYHTFLHLLIRDPIRNREHITAVYGNMQEFGFIPSADAYSRLIKCCTKWNDVEFALRLYDEMRDHKFQLTAETYTDLISVCSRQRGLASLGRGLEFWRQMLADGLAPVQSTFLRVMEIHSRLKLADGLEEVYFAAMESVFKYKQHHGIDQKSLDERPTTSQRLSKTQLEAITRAPQMHLTFTNAYMSALVTLEKYEEALRAYQSLYADGGPLTAEKAPSDRGMEDLFNILLKISYGKRDVEGARKVWDDMVRRNVQPDETAYGRMISIFGRANDLDSAKGWLEQGVERLGVAPGSARMLRLRNALLIAYAENGRIDDGIRLLEVMREEAERRDGSEGAKGGKGKDRKHGGTLLRSGVLSMVDACVRAGDLPQALAIWELLPQQEVKVKAEEEDKANKADASESLVETWKLTKEEVIRRFHKMHPAKQE